MTVQPKKTDCPAFSGKPNGTCTPNKGKKHHPTTAPKNPKRGFYVWSKRRKWHRLCVHCRCAKVFDLKKVSGRNKFLRCFFDYGRIWETCLCFFLFENLGKGVGFFSGKQGWIYIEKSVKRMDFVWNEFIRKKKHDQAIEWCNAKAKTSANENHHLHSLLVNPPRQFPEVHLSDFPQSKNCFPPVSVGKKYFGGSSSYPGNYIG